MFRKMSRSSEEVLLVVNHVKHKKTEGTLYMMGQRMAWMHSAQQSFSISHNYADIRVQKISPDTKDKVQLQVLMHDGGANTFHFVNQAGRDAQQKDREGVKELLQQLLPQFRNKVNSELEEKNRILQSDPDLFQLYKDLVVSQIMTADEFWVNRTGKNENKTKLNQEVGVSAAFLADIKPQTDGCNGIRYNLTTDIIESIFRTYPAVKKKHIEYVPGKMSEQDFWIKFFQSHYFHRDRINFSSKDVFAECATSDDKEMQEELETPLPDSLVDLCAISDDTKGDGYGLTDGQKANSTNNVNSTLIKRFNQHSTMVLKACETKTSRPEPSKSFSSSSGVANGSCVSVSNGLNSSVSLNSGFPSSSSICSLNSMNDESEQPPSKKAKVREKIEYTDLESSSTDSSLNAALRLNNLERYLQGPTQDSSISYTSSEDILHAHQAFSQELVAWRPQLNQTLQSNQASSALGELTPGGRLMQGQHQQELTEMVPESVQLEIKQHYAALSELLRHFWSCFPATTKSLKEKVVRVKTNLERFQMSKLVELKSKLHSYHYTLDLTGHIEDMLQAAFTKFNSWQARELSRR